MMTKSQLNPSLEGLPMPIALHKTGTTKNMTNKYTLHNHRKQLIWQSTNSILHSYAHSFLTRCIVQLSFTDYLPSD